MNQRQLASVLFAVLGLFLAVTWLPQVFLQARLLSHLPSGSTDDEYGRAVSITYLISTGIAVFLGLGLMVSRDRLARRLFPDDTPAFTPRDTQAVALSVLGAYFVVMGICRLVASDEIHWSAAVQVVLGLWLFLGARGIARFWTWLRSAGVATD